MEAKVKPEHRWNMVKAFSGSEFVKDEFRPVPDGFEGAAQAHPFLEVREGEAKKAEKTPEEKAAFAEKMRLAKEAKKAEKAAEQKEE